MDQNSLENDTIVCYCSRISVGEIRRSVHYGCKTIPEVRDYLGKQITGKCKTTSPTGKCCHRHFNEVIADTAGTGHSSVG